jgi:hypothetical protein
MRNTNSPARRNRLLLPVLAVLLLAAMAVVSYALFESGEVEAASVQLQSVRAATVTRVRLVRFHRNGRAAGGALVAAPKDQQDVRWMVEFCDTATSVDVPALRDVALTAESPLAVGNAVRALGRLGAVAKDRDLLKLLNDPRGRVRDEFILALGESGDASALALLEPLVRAGDEHVRVLAIRAIGRIGGEKARRMLADVAADPAGTPETAAFARAGLVESVR